MDPFTRDAFVQAIVIVEETLSEMRRHLPPAQKAELVAAAAELLTRDERSEVLRLIQDTAVDL